LIDNRGNSQADSTPPLVACLDNKGGDIVAALLEARRVTKAFGGGVFTKSKVNVALEDFSMTIQDSPPSITAIVGESGSGKTTLARTILGMTPPTSGEVLYRGTDLRRLDGDQRRQFLRDVQVIFQDPYEVYNPFYKVDHVLEVPVANFNLAPSKEKARALIEEALQAVGLRPDETLGRYPHQLSGGQRQRLMVARAMIMRPRLIIADEPVSMVDASLRATILDSLRDLNEKLGVSIIYITHDLTTAYQLSENIIVLYRGSIAEVGDVERVVNAPEHPYTRLLISSIPLPDLGRPWEKERVIPEHAGGRMTGRLSCQFVDRCPSAMEVCREKAPPLFQTEDHRAAACFLYRDRPELGLGDVHQVFAAKSSVPIEA
jgi:peptide/nickel transport system ATP-binding protein